MIKKFFSYLLIILISFIFYECSDDPTSVGLNQIPAGDHAPLKEANTDSLIQSSFYLKENLSTVSATRVVIGRNGNAESSILMKFKVSTFADSFATYLSENRLSIKSAKVILTSDYSIGSGNLPIKVFKITDPWSRSFNVDSLSKANSWTQEITNPGSFIYTDTSITFGLEEGYVKNTLLKGVDTNAVDEPGIYLKPDAISGNRALGFSVTSGIKLQLIVQTPVSSPDTLDCGLDSVIHVVKLNNNYPSNDGYLYVQGGVSENAFLKFYFPTIPDHAIINYAELQLPYDSTKSSFASSTSNQDMLDINFVVSDSAEVIAGKDSVIGTGLLEKKSSNLFTGDITAFVREWFDKTSTEKNNGLKISFYDQVNTIDLIALISEQKQSQFGLKPRIKIIYSVP